jgi:mannose-6-phosphate isomerase-like protein (cupin superfamily)
VSEVFELPQLLAEISHNHLYHQFLRVPALSAGVYVLPAGSIDGQRPHGEDEIYYVIRGVAKMRAGNEVRSIQHGSVIFVEAGLDHRFFDIEQELLVLVVFAPAETSEA